MKNYDRVSIGYKVVGRGEKKVIALHSWMDDAESWNLMIPFLDIEKFTYVFMDLRGYGSSKQIKGIYNSDEVVSDLFNLADDLKWNNFYLIGHSMSGLIAQKAALLDINNRILKIALVTPVSAGGFEADESTINFFKSIVQNEEVATIAYGVFTSNRLSDFWKRIRAKRHIEITHDEAQLAYIDMWTKESFLEKMTDIKKHFLVLSGQYDFQQFRSEQQTMVFKDFQMVEHITLENSGHFPMQECPVYLTSVIENYFALS